MLKEAVILVLLFGSFLASGQSVKKDKLDKGAQEFAKLTNQLSTAYSTPIMNGPVYKFKPRARSGHPFYIQRYWMPGMIRFNGNWYSDLYLLIDLEDHTVVVRPGTGTKDYGVIPDQSSIDKVVIDESTFVKIDQLPDDYLQVVYSGNSISLLARHEKEVDLLADGSYYLSNTSYYLLYDNKLSPIRSWKSLKKLDAEIFEKVKAEQKKVKSNDEKLLMIVKSFDYEM